MAKGFGSMIGGVLGGAAGSVVAPGAGTQVGAALGQSIGGMIDSARAKREADAIQIPLEDPEQRRLLEEIRGIRNDILAGTDVTTRANIGDIQQGTSAAMNAITRSTGGNAGQTIDAILKASRIGGRSVNQAIGQSQQRLPYFQSLVEQMQDKISQRKIDIPMYNKMQASAEAAQYGKEALSNFSAGVMTGTFDPAFNAIGQGVRSGAENVAGMLADLRRSPDVTPQIVSNIFPSQSSYEPAPLAGPTPSLSTYRPSVTEINNQAMVTPGIQDVISSLPR